jgi:WD40 repeat protein
MSRLWGTLLALAAGLSLVASPSSRAEPADAESSQSAPDSKPVATDAFGDPLPAGVKLRMGSTRLRHSRGVYFVGFSAEGKVLVSAGNDSVVRISDVATGKELRHFDMPAGNMGGGSSSMSSGDVRIVHHYEAYYSLPLVLSPDGATLAALGNDGAVHMWDVAKGMKLRRLSLKGEWPQHILFSPDGKQLASWGHDQVVHLSDAVTGKSIRQLGKAPDQENRVYYGREGRPLAYSPDGKRLATFVAVQDKDGKTHGLVTLWETETGKQTQQIKLEQRYYGGVLAFTPDGKSVLYAGNEGTMHFFDPESGKEQRKLERNGSMSSLVFAPDGKTFATRESQWAPVMVRDTATGKEVKKLGADAASEASGFFTNWSWRETGPTDLAFTPDGKTIAVALPTGAIRLWDVAGGKELLASRGHQGGITGLSVSPDGKTLITTAEDYTLRQWHLDSGKEFRRTDLPPGTGRAVFARDGKSIAFGTGTDKLHVWDPAAGKKLHTVETGKAGFGGLPPAGGGLALSADGKRMALRDYDGMIRLYDTVAGKESGKFSIKMPNQPTVAFVNGLAPGIVLTPDGGRVAVVGGTGGGSDDGIDWGNGAGNSVVRFWDVERGRTTLQFESRKLDILTLAIAPNGWTLATAHPDGTVSLWETITGKERARLKMKEGGLLSGVTNALSGGGRKTDPKAFCLVFSPDGRLLAGAGDDRRVHLWDIRTGRKLGSLTGHEGAIHCLAFLSDGRGLVSGGTDSTALLYDISAMLPEETAAEELEDEALQKAWTDLTGDDAGKAYKALVLLSGVPKQALPLTRERIKPAAAVAPERVRLLLSDLENKQFHVRQRATDILERYAELVEDDLKRALDARPPLEVRRRLERLLDRIGTGAAPPTELLEALRTLELLEQIGTSEAQQGVAAIARGVPNARLTREAKTVEQRMTKQP